MLRFVLADLRRHWIGVIAIVLILALATALGVTVTLQERALRLGSARAAAAFDLVVGAPGSETQLVLSAVFLQAAPLPLLPGDVLARLVADPRVAWAAPVGFGDFVDGQPIVGTTQALVDGLGGIAEGGTFTRLGEAVVGAAVKAQAGSTFHPVHGQLGHSGEVHAEIGYTVVGRLHPTGTAWDRAVLVPIETVWRIHAHEAGPHEHAHEEPLDLTAPITPDAVTHADAGGVPAIVVKPRTIANAYQLRQDYRRGEQTVAVFPGEVLTRLYGTLGDARLVLSAVSLGAQILVAAAILLIVTLHVLQRRRQIGALRAFGAPRPVVCAIVWLESLIVSGMGLLLGFVSGYGVAALLSRIVTQRSGMVMPVTMTAPDCAALAIGLVVAGLAGLVPAALAYRQSPGLSLRS